MPTVQEHVSLKPFNTFGVDASARYFVAVQTVAALRELLTDPALGALPRLVIGGGSNLLLTRDFPGLVIRLELSGRRVIEDDGVTAIVEAAAGENWHAFVLWTLDLGLNGLENLSLIPGSVGAAPIQNIGAYGVEMKDTFHHLEAIDIANGDLREFSAGQCRFGYRDSTFKHEWKDRAIITRVAFRLSRSAPLHLDYGDVRAELGRAGVTSPTARDVSNAVIAIRRRKLPDPALIGNAGSFFKNPVLSADRYAKLHAAFPAMPHYPAGEGLVKVPAGWLIDQCGFKGRRLGAAGVHPEHALVLVNNGGASGTQIWALAGDIRASVNERFGVMLDPEPIVV